MSVIDTTISFEEHLENASRIVATWPEWKQNILGAIQVKTKRIQEDDFYIKMLDVFQELSYIQEIKSVSGPGRSGAIAAVYASYILKVPFIPYGQVVPDNIRPHLVVDTASLTGSTLKKAIIKMKAEHGITIIQETSHIKFWYEN